MTVREPDRDSPGASQPAFVGVLAVVGVGLIGGSFAAALRKNNVVGRVLGVGRHAKTLEQACSLGLIDEAVTLQRAAEQADIILLAVPVGATRTILEGLEPYLREGTVVTDAGSTKRNVVQDARDVLGEKIGQFIPGHPVAGAEVTGPAAADADLFSGRTVVLTPLRENTTDAKALLTRVWECCGARVVTMEAQAHDVALASVSHVPHFLAAVFMQQVAAAPDADSRMALAGTGFRDFTRIAAGSPEMWRDIFLANREALLSELREVKAALAQAEQCVCSGDSQKLYDFLERAALARRFWGARSGLS